jgi:hypothetical protein
METCGIRSVIRNAPSNARRANADLESRNHLSRPIAGEDDLSTAIECAPVERDFRRRLSFLRWFAFEDAHSVPAPRAGKPCGEVSAPQARTFPRRFTEAPIQKPKAGGPRSAMSRNGLPAKKVAK